MRHESSSRSLGLLVTATTLVAVLAMVSTAAPVEGRLVTTEAHVGRGLVAAAAARELLANHTVTAGEARRTFEPAAPPCEPRPHFAAHATRIRVAPRLLDLPPPTC
jgi:hypothetical protein